MSSERCSQPHGSDDQRPTTPPSQDARPSPCSLWTGVSCDLTAFHTDTISTEGRHQHTWTVWAWFSGRPFIDARCQREALRTVLGVYEGKDLPPELWAGEAIAALVLRLLPGCIKATTERPGFRAEAVA